MSKGLEWADSQKSRESQSIPGRCSHNIVPLTLSDTFSPVSHASPQSFASNLPAYHDLEDMMRYSSPPASVIINKNVYKAPNSSQLSDPALITAASPPQQPRASEPRGRKIRTCSNSGEVGHNVRTCPESYCSFCIEDGHKLRDCTLAQEEAEAIKQQEDEEAAVRVPWNITQVDGL